MTVNPLQDLEDSENLQLEGGYLFGLQHRIKEAFHQTIQEMYMQFVDEWIKENPNVTMQELFIVYKFYNYIIERA